MDDVAHIALGSNLGDRRAYLAGARSGLSLIPGSRLVAATRIEETIPLGTIAQGPYLNQMVVLQTSLSPTALLDELQRIEDALGRTRDVRWGPRTIDLDIVQFGNAELDTPRLTLPHPGLATRDFWQRELEELEMTTSAHPAT